MGGFEFVGVPGEDLGECAAAAVGACVAVEGDEGLGGGCVAGCWCHFGGVGTEVVRVLGCR